MDVLRVALSLGKFPHEVLALPLCEFETLASYIEITDEAAQNA